MRWLATIQFFAGLAAFSVVLYLIYLSGREDFTIATEALLLAIVIVILLLYGPEELGQLIEKWRR